MEPIDQIRSEFPAKLRYSHVLAIAEEFGFSRNAGRKLIEGADAPIKGKPFGPAQRQGQSQRPRKFYDREEILAVLQSS